MPSNLYMWCLHLRTYLFNLWVSNEWFFLCNLVRYCLRVTGIYFLLTIIPKSNIKVRRIKEMITNERIS